MALVLPQHFCQMEWMSPGETDWSTGEVFVPDVVLHHRSFSFFFFFCLFFFNIARCVNPLCSSYLGEKTNKKRAFFLVCLLICFCLSFWSVSSPLSLPGYCCLEGDFSSTLSASCQTLWVRFTCRQTPYVYVWVRMGLCIFLLARLLLQ